MTSWDIIIPPPPEDSVPHNSLVTNFTFKSLKCVPISEIIVRVAVTTEKK